MNTADMILMGAFLLVLAGIGWRMGPAMWDAIPKEPKSKTSTTEWPRRRN
jgi:hypothetical protein